MNVDKLSMTFDGFINSTIDTAISNTYATTYSKNSDNFTMSTIGQEGGSFQEVSESMSDYKASLAVWWYCPLILLPLGTVGNVMTIWILCYMPMGGSSTIPLFFRALAVSDLCLLYSGLLRNWIKYYFHFDIRVTHSAVCKVHIWLVYVAGMTSAWFLVAMTSHRSLSVVWPHRTKAMFTKRTALVVIAVIVVLAALLNAHSFYGYDVVYYESDKTFYCDYENHDYENFARGVWPWIDMAFSSLLPFILLIINNSLLMWKVASSVRDVMTLTHSAGHVAAVSQRKKMSTSINLTLICLSAMFLLLTSPVLVYLILENFLPDAIGTNPELWAKMELAWAVTNNLWYANSTVNFYVYLLSGSKFRQRVVQCLCCLALDSPRGKTNVSVSVKSVSGSVVGRAARAASHVIPDETTEF